jgi:hypothetical protein
MLITFSLFWVVIKNNLMYCVRTGNVDGGGLWFPSAINQTFIGIYFLEICLTGLFFLVRDTEDNVACDAQGIIMAVVLVLTVLYQIWLMMHLGRLFKYAPIRLEVESENLLNDSATGQSQEINEPSESLGPEKASEAGIALNTLSTNNELVEGDADDALPDLALPPKRPTFRTEKSGQSRGSDMQAKRIEDAQAAKGVLARINKPLDEARLQQLEKALGQAEKKVGNVLMPRRKDIEAQMMNDPISRIILQHNDELETLEPEERDLLISVAFTHPVLRAPRPCVWIPRDDLGISDDEVRRTRAFSDHVDIENRGAAYDQKLKVVVDEPPPDLDQFSIVINEL